MSDIFRLYITLVMSQNRNFRRLVKKPLPIKAKSNQVVDCPYSMGMMENCGVIKEMYKSFNFNKLLYEKELFQIECRRPFVRDAIF